MAGRFFVYFGSMPQTFFFSTRKQFITSSLLLQTKKELNMDPIKNNLSRIPSLPSVSINRYYIGIPTGSFPKSSTTTRWTVSALSVGPSSRHNLLETILDEALALTEETDYLQDQWEIHTVNFTNSVFALNAVGLNLCILTLYIFLRYNLYLHFSLRLPFTRIIFFNCFLAATSGSTNWHESIRHFGFIFHNLPPFSLSSPFRGTEDFGAWIGFHVKSGDTH